MNDDDILKTPCTPDDLAAIRRLREALTAFGAILTLGMVWRAQVSGDQLNLLARGYLFAKDGILVPYGNHMSGGGDLPGIMTSLVIGIPLKLWFDYRAVSLSLWILHLGAYAIFDRVLSRFVGERGRLAFCMFYWLSPWRIYYAVLIWNPSYLYLLTAVHLWSVSAQRRSPSFFASLCHVLAIGLGVQLHASAASYCLYSFLLWRFGYFQIAWSGITAGVAIVIATLIPWIPAVLHDPSIRPASQQGHFIGRGLLYVYPFARGVFFTVKLASFSVFARIYRFDFRSLFSTEIDAVLTPLMKVIGHTYGVFTLIIAIAAYCWFYRQYPLATFFKNVDVNEEGRAADRKWFFGITVLGFATALTSYALSPTAMEPWQLVIFHHLAVFPLALFFDDRLVWESSPCQRLRQQSRWLIPVGLTILLAVGIASPYYRRAGRGSMGIPLRNYHPILDELHLLRDFDLTVHDDGVGWWFDVFPDAHPPPGGPDNWKGKPWEAPDWNS